MYKSILLLISSILITACSEQPNSLNEQSQTSDLKKTEAQCVELRNEWQRLQLSGFNDNDLKKSEEYLASYKDGGCLETCGRLVEDTDTPEKETWCN